MSALIGEDKTVCFEGFPEFRGEYLTEECPGPQTLNQVNVTMPYFDDNNYSDNRLLNFLHANPSQ